MLRSRSGALGVLLSYALARPALAGEPPLARVFANVNPPPALPGAAAPSAVAPTATAPIAGATSARDSLPSFTPELDDALRLVLATGCQAGIDQMRGLVAAGGPPAAIATEVVRLCAEVRGPGTPHRPPAQVIEVPSISGPPALDRRGRSRLVPALTLYGIWAGIAFDDLADIDGDRAIILFPLLGMAGGLVGSILATRTGQITTGQAWSIVTGLEYGTVSGMFWAGAIGRDSDKDVIGTGLVTGVIGGGVGLLVAGTNPRAGAVEVVRSGGLWGTAAALMLILAFSPEEPSSRAVLTTLGVGLDAGMLAGALVAYRVPISVNRTLLIDAGALAGSGFGLGLTWLIGGSGGHRQLIGAGGLAGLATGIAVAVLLTGGTDSSADNLARASVPALVVRDDRGHFGLGGLGLAPVLGLTDSGRTRVTGATATLLGGNF